MQLLTECGFVLSIAPPPLSRDRKIKMKKNIKSKGQCGEASLLVAPLLKALSEILPCPSWCGIQMADN